MYPYYGYKTQSNTTLLLLYKQFQNGTKCLVIARLPEHDTARRVDFMYTPKEEFPFAILYFTGSKTFNTIMRGNALKKGFSLNEHGLYVKKPGQKKEEKISEKIKYEYILNDSGKYVKKEIKTIVTKKEEKKQEPKVPQPLYKDMKLIAKDIWEVCYA